MSDDPLSTVLQAVEGYVDEIERRQHDDATIDKRDRILAAIRQLREPARIDAGEEHEPLAQETRTGVWDFNRDYQDLAQVIPFVEDYWTVYEQIKAEGRYPYNQSFEGRISGLEGVPRQETAIYLLQQLRHLVEGHERIAKLLAGGFRRLTELPARERFATVIVFDRFYAAQQYDDARVLAGDDDRPVAVLPNGARTRGRRLGALDRVYVR